MKPLNLTKKEFEQKICAIDGENPQWNYLGERPALIDFYASWCGPCKALAPVLDRIADKYSDKIDVYKIDVDQENELAAAFNVRSVPTLLFVPMDGQPSIAQGALPQGELEDAVEKILLAETAVK